MENLLDKLEKENKQNTKQLRLDHDKSIVNQIISGLFETLRLPQFSDYNDYRNYLNIIPKEYGAKHIAEFSIRLKDYENLAFFKANMGFYLSALINNYNDVGNSLGYHMIKGSIEVNGNCEGHVGSYLCTGIIIVNGSVKDFAGHKMCNGKIVINGNAGFYLGGFMENGIIEVNGEISDISDNCKGTIYHKNKLIIKNGKKV